MVKAVAEAAQLARMSANVGSPDLMGTNSFHACAGCPAAQYREPSPASDRCGVAVSSACQGAVTIETEDASSDVGAIPGVGTAVAYGRSRST